MKVIGKSLDPLPKGVWKIVVPEKSSVQMTSLPVETESARELFGHPDINKASVTYEEAEFRTKRLTRTEEMGELDLGNPVDLLKGCHKRESKAARNLSRSVSRWSKAKKSSNASRS